MKPRLYLDEDVNPALAQLLREAGYDVISAHEIGALAETDREQLHRATADGRAILTYNYYDFEVIAREEAAAGRSHAGIIISYRQYARRRLGALAALVAVFLESTTADELRNVTRALSAEAPSPHDRLHLLPRRHRRAAAGGRAPARQHQFLDAVASSAARARCRAERDQRLTVTRSSGTASARAVGVYWKRGWTVRAQSQGGPPWLPTSCS